MWGSLLDGLPHNGWFASQERLPFVHERPRWGILATGRISTDFVRDLTMIGGIVAAVGSRHLASARAFADRFGIRRAYGSYQELVADPDVDIVYVGTPNTMHTSNALLALEAGKHALVEKPFAVNATDARLVVEQASDRGLVVLEAMWTRWMPHMMRVRELVRSGALGELRGLVADCGLRLPDDPGHRVHNPRLAGGALLDLGVYPVSFAWDLFGAPDRIHAIGDMTPSGVDAMTSVLIGFPGRRQAALQTTLDVRTTMTATVFGTEARLQIDPFWFFPSSFTLVDPAGRVIERFDESIPGRGMQFEAIEMERLVTEGRLSGDILPPWQSVKIMETLDEIRSQIGLHFPAEEDERERKIG